MFVTETTRTARNYMKKHGRGSIIFNDRLADGRRSLKVWGWSEQDYTQVARILNAAGHSSEIVSFEVNRWGKSKIQYRLHVLEK